MHALYIRSSALLNKIRFTITPTQKHGMKGIVTKPAPSLNSMLSFKENACSIHPSDHAKSRLTVFFVAIIDGCKFNLYTGKLSVGMSSSLQ